MKNEIAQTQKIKIEDLTTDELIKVWGANSKLRKEVCNEIYEDNMNVQYTASCYLLHGCDKYYKMEDHYSSFYLRITDGIEFMRHLDFTRLKEYGLITTDEIDYCKSIIHQYECNDEVASSVYDTLEDKAKLYLAKIEKFLHDYEDYPTEADALDYFIDAEVDCYICSDCYIKNNGSYVMYRDVTENYA